MPDKNMKSPALMPGLCGNLKLRDTLSMSFFGCMISRFAAMFFSGRLNDGHCVQLNLESVDDLNAPDGPCRRAVGNVLSIDAVEHVILDTVVNAGVDRDQSVERGAGFFQNQLEIVEYPVSFLGHVAEHALTRFRINRDDTRNKYIISGARRAALLPAELQIHVQPGGGWGNNIASKRHAFLLQAFGTTPPASRSLGRQRRRRASTRSAIAVSIIIRNIMIRIIEMAPAVLYCVE